MQLGTDNFSRNVVSGPGTASDGQAWVVNGGTSSHYSVSGNQLNYAYDSHIFSKLLLGFGSSQDFNFLARFTPGSSSDSFGFCCRYISANDNITCGINASNNYYVTALAAGVEYDYASSGTVSVITGTAVWVRVAVLGTQVQIKYWVDGTTEPTLYGYTVTIAPASFYGQYGLVERVGTVSTTLLTDSFNATNNTTTPLATLGGYIFPASTDAMSNITALTPLNTIRPEYWYVGNGHLGTPGVLINETVAYEPVNSGSWGPSGYSTGNAALIKAQSTQQFVTVSGAEWPDGTRTAISALATNTTLLTNFCNTLVTFCTQNGFSGIDLDMELHGGWATTPAATTWAQLKTIITALGNALHNASLLLIVDGPTFTVQGSVKWNWSQLNALPVDYMTVRAYDNFYNTITGGSANPSSDYAMAPLAWVAQVIAFMQTQITNVDQLIVAVTSDAYYINNNDTTFASVSENTGANGYSNASGWAGFSAAAREKTSLEMMWSTGGVTYVYSDAVTLNAKIAACLDNGISNIAIYYVGSSNPWPTVIPPLIGSGGSGGSGGSSAGITLTNVGLNLIRDALVGAVSNIKISYVALGTGGSAPNAAQSTLDHEVYRKAVTGYTSGSVPGEAIITMYLAPGDAINIGIKEFGFYAGKATALLNSGTLVARGLYNHTHLNTESIQFGLDFIV